MPTSTPRHLEAEHHTDLAHAHGGNQLLKPFAIAVGTRQSQVAVDDHHPVQRPTKGKRSLPQRVLAFRAFGVLKNLTQCALAHVEICASLQMAGGDLLMVFRIHVQHLRCRLNAIWASKCTNSVPTPAIP